MGVGELITIPFVGASNFITTPFVEVGGFIAFPFVGTFFFFLVGALAGGEGAKRLSPGAFRKVPSYLLSSHSLRSALRAWASAFRTAV